MSTELHLCSGVLLEGPRVNMSARSLACPLKTALMLLRWQSLLPITLDSEFLGMIESFGFCRLISVTDLIASPALLSRLPEWTRFYVVYYIWRIPSGNLRSLDTLSEHAIPSHRTRRSRTAHKGLSLLDPRRAGEHTQAGSQAVCAFQPRKRRECSHNPCTPWTRFSEGKFCFFLHREAPIGVIVLWRTYRVLTPGAGTL